MFGYVNINLNELSDENKKISSSVAPGAMPSTLYGSILLTPS
jgi:hypothetical protein